MPDYLGNDMRKTKEGEEKEEKEIKGIFLFRWNIFFSISKNWLWLLSRLISILALDEADIALLKSYGQGHYSKTIKQVEEDIQSIIKRVNELTGIKESDTGLAPPALWDLAADKQALQNEQPLQVARCTKIINADTDNPKYIINVKQFAKFVVDLADSVAPTDIEEGMRVGYV